MKLSFLSLASGSSGNCYYLGTPEFGVLIDAGIGIRTIKKVLKDKDRRLSGRETLHSGLYDGSRPPGDRQEPLCGGNACRFA